MALGGLCERHGCHLELALGAHRPEFDEGDFRAYDLVLELYWPDDAFLTGLTVPWESTVQHESHRLLRVIARELEHGP